MVMIIMLKHFCVLVCVMGNVLCKADSQSNTVGCVEYSTFHVTLLFYHFCIRGMLCSV